MQWLIVLFGGPGDGLECKFDRLPPLIEVPTPREINYKHYTEDELPPTAEPTFDSVKYFPSSVNRYTKYAQYRIRDH